MQSLAASGYSVKCLSFQVASKDLVILCPWAAAGWSFKEATPLCGSWGAQLLASLL